jgi:hypothetical protein
MTAVSSLNILPLLAETKSKFNQPKFNRLFIRINESRINMAILAYFNSQFQKTVAIFSLPSLICVSDALQMTSLSNSFVYCNFKA